MHLYQMNVDSEGGVCAGFGKKVPGIRCSNGKRFLKGKRGKLF